MQRMTSAVPEMSTTPVPGVTSVDCYVNCYLLVDCCQQSPYVRILQTHSVQARNAAQHRASQQERVAAVPMTWTVLVTQLPGLDRKLTLDSAKLFECTRRCYSFTSFGQSSSLFFQLATGSLGACGGARLQPDVAARPMDLTRGARGKRRGFSPGAAARHPQSARVHTDSFLHARVHTASPPKTFFFPWRSEGIKK